MQEFMYCQWNKDKNVYESLHTCIRATTVNGLQWVKDDDGKLVDFSPCKEVIVRFAGGHLGGLEIIFDLKLNALDL